MISVRLGGEHKGEHSQCAMGEHWALNWWAQSSPFVLTRVLTYKRMLCRRLGAKWALSTGGGKTTPHTPHIRKARLEGAPMRRPSGTFTQCPPILCSPPCRHGGGPPAGNGAFRGKSNRYLEKDLFPDASRKPRKIRQTFFPESITRPATPYGAIAPYAPRGHAKYPWRRVAAPRVANDGRPGGRSAPRGQRGGTGAAYRDHLGRCNCRPDSSRRLP
jgi:hypothetical protein